MLIDWNSFGVSSAVRAGELSAIESAVFVVISDLLTVCVAISESAELLLPVNCCLFALLICARSIVPVTCSTRFPAYFSMLNADYINKENRREAVSAKRPLGLRGVDFLTLLNCD
ncbi:hypothetical protein AVEN_52828-1 [Araneus ventricosus]|uniref:Uncharacterized protein n=1 Tax=Araneus ventricosus TaxID=182803 RepID=A0A4Y2VHQ9_ARAVE|nr:hypothetical protein AVEN_52828-1 [Araneus ventricosus]